MNIACIGWGSLVWDPRNLPVLRGWFNDGPLLPIEFARESSDERITLVLVESRPVRSLWALMSCGDLDSARRALCERERIPRKNLESDIGYWSTEKHSTGIGSKRIGRWAEQLHLGAAVWTALPPGFRNDRGKKPSAEEVIAYLKGLDGQAREHAEKYVRHAPPQIDTETRRVLESELGWTPEADCATDI